MTLASTFRRAQALMSGAIHSGRRPRLVVQAGALPWRAADQGRMEILLVTSRNSARWIVPKGWPMRGKSLSQAAAQEALEEAGVYGIALEQEIGSFDHAKTHPVLGRLTCRILVFPLQVDTELEDWPERGERERSWMSPEEAAARVDSDDLRRIILGFSPA